MPALVAAVLAAGCAAGETTAEHGEGRPDRSGPAERSSGSTPSDASAASASPDRTAAEDGTDLSACRDADCEVVVRDSADIPLDRRFGCDLFRVTPRQPDQVRFVVLRSQTNDVNGYIGGTGYLSLANGVTMTVVRADGDSAVLRFEPRAEDPRNDRASGSTGLGLFGEGS